MHQRQQQSQAHLVLTALRSVLGLQMGGRQRWARPVQLESQHLHPQEAAVGPVHVGSGLSAAGSSLHMGSGQMLGKRRHREGT